MIRIDTAHPHDARGLVIRSIDLREIRRYGRLGSPCKVVEGAIRDSYRAFTLWEDHAVAAVGGIILSAMGRHPWVICGPQAAAHGKTIVRFAKQVLREEAALGPVNNLTPSKGPREEAFLRHLGFSVTAVREQSLLVLENPP